MGMGGSDGRVLDVENVRKRFGGVVALDGATLGVGDRSLVMLIGPNGSGKTTLINVVSGIYRLDDGRVRFNGTDITGWPPHKIYQSGVVRTFQIPALFTKLTVLENLLVAARSQVGENLSKAVLKKTWVEQEEELVEKAFNVLEILNLDSLWNTPVNALSGGQMKLVEIGRALMSDPRVILMDEPIAGINPRLAHEIFEHILGLRRELGISFLIVEHRLDIALQYVDHVYAMHRGRVIAEGKPKDVVNTPEVIESYLGG